MISIFRLPNPGQIYEKDLKTKLGSQAASILQLSSSGIPFLPGFIIELSNLKIDSYESLQTIISQGIAFIENETGKQLGSVDHPLLLKTSLLPDINLASTFQVSNLGINRLTIDTLGKGIGIERTYQTFLQFIEEFAVKCLGYESHDFKLKPGEISEFDYKTRAEYILSQVVTDFPFACREQVEITLRKMTDFYHRDILNTNIPAALLIQYQPCLTSVSYSHHGVFFTRDPVSGKSLAKDKITCNQPLTDIAFNQLKKISLILEQHFLDVRRVEFSVEKNRIWIIAQTEVSDRSIRSKLWLLSDLFEDKKISEQRYLGSVSPNELNDLLFPTTYPASIKHLVEIQGGMGGSPGAAIGIIFFSTPKLLAAFWQAREQGDDTNMILLKSKTQGEDIPAIEISQAVITSYGGYTSHAPIIARHLGKPAIIYPDIVFQEKHAYISGHKIEEGQYLSLEVPTSGTPSIYLGKAKLNYPDIEHSGLLELLSKAKKYTWNLKVLANADTPEEAAFSKNLGADGVGLCRTEHMFLREDRLPVFRKYLFAQSKQQKKRLLQTIKKFLISDFVKLFEIMEEKPITMRLLDAPLHEFLPVHEERRKEINPMLGHRGCRLGISLPEIYETQIVAFLQAAFTVFEASSKVVCVEIMVPFIISAAEMYIIRNGKTLEGVEIKGINGVVQELLSQYKIKKLPFKLKIGAMIELPAAALSAADIAKQADFFSFGTNDLTQTTLGISRDDSQSFLPTYEAMDIWSENPFKNLVGPVKELINSALQSGRQIRPDLKIGICGEHTANPQVIKYCLEQGMDYVSCSPYNIPAVILTIAQENLYS